MLRARRLVDGLYAGSHPSPRRGAGIEFHEYRAYATGDDPGAIDWKLFGRTDRLYVRRYRQHTDLRLYVMVDASASMDYAGDGGDRTKLDVACEIAAALAMLAVRQADRVGLGVFDATLRRHLPIAGSWQHLQHVIRAIDELRPAAGPGDAAHAMRQAHRLLRPRTSVVVIGDFLDDPAALLDGVARLRHPPQSGCGVTLLQVLTPEELDLNRLRADRIRLADVETPLRVTTDVDAVAARYRELIEGHVQTLRRGAAALGAEHLLVRTDEDLGAVLARWLR